MVNPSVLSYNTIPINVEINVIRGELQNPNAPKPQIKINIGEGGIKIDTEPAKINIDTYAARSSMGLGKLNYKDLINKEVSKGKKLAYEGTSRTVSEGNQLQKGTTPGQLAIKNERAGMTIQTVMEHIPKAGADVKFEKGPININYDNKEVNIDWKNLKVVPLEYRPGRVEYNITQMPSIEINYVGGWIYVPPSADPNYSGPKLNMLV